MSDKDTCPVNGCNLQGEPIAVEYLEFYYGDATHYSRKLGVEIPGVYDGVLYWACPDCGARWHRWSAISELGADMRKAAQPFVDAAEWTLPIDVSGLAEFTEAVA